MRLHDRKLPIRSLLRQPNLQREHLTRSKNTSELRIAADLPKAPSSHTPPQASAAGAQINQEDVMKSKVVVSLFAFLVLLAGVAQAQDHSNVDIFAGYSYDRWDGAKNFNLNGGSASVAYNVNNWLSGVADFGGYHNGNVLNTGLDFTLSTYLFGPRISYRHWNRVTPFGEVLFGAERVSTSTATASRSDNNFAMTVGGGFDAKLAKHFSVRPIKVDYLLTRFAAAGADPQSQKNLRVSTGVVFHF